MIGELDFFGVFVPMSLVAALAAGVLHLAVRRLFEVTGFYRLVWHRSLFDLALFVLLWGAVSALAAGGLRGGAS